MSACLNSAQQSCICFVFFHNLSCCGIVCCELIKVMQQGEEPLTYLLRLYFEGLLLFLLHCVFNKSIGTFILGCVRPRTALARCISIIQSLSEWYCPIVQFCNSFYVDVQMIGKRGSEITLLYITEVHRRSEWTVSHPNSENSNSFSPSICFN